MYSIMTNINGKQLQIMHGKIGLKNNRDYYSLKRQHYQ